MALGWLSTHENASRGWTCGYCGKEAGGNVGYCRDGHSDKIIYICPHCQNPTAFIASDAGSGVEQIPGPVCGHEMATEAQLRANAKYAKANVKRMGVSFYPSERDIYEWLQTQPNKQGYVKALIRADMERARGE